MRHAVSLLLALLVVSCASAPRTATIAPSAPMTFAEIRASIDVGLLPHGTILLDELINDFAYSYPPPAGAEPLSITTEIAACPWDDTKRLLLVGVRAGELAEPLSVSVQVELDGTKGAALRRVGESEARQLRSGSAMTLFYEYIPVRGARGAIAAIHVGHDGGAVVATAEEKGTSVWDASLDFQFAAAVAAFGKLLIQPVPLDSREHRDVLQLAKIGRGPDPGGARDELIALIEKSRENADAWTRAAST